MDEDLIENLFDLTELAVESSDLDHNEDVEIILDLLECCENASHPPSKRRKREWVKQWRINRVEQNKFPFLLDELFNDTSSFLNNIGMKPEIFNYILSKIEKDIKRKDTIMRKSITPAEKLAATLRYLATGESYKSTNYKTTISGSLLCIAIPEVCEAIWKHFKDEFLKLPSTKSEWEAIADNFEVKWQFPNCLGALDTKHIEFRTLRRDGSNFHNYKGTNSIVMLALVDADYRFIYIDVGCNGRTDDAGVLLQSELKGVIDNAEKFFPADKIMGTGIKLPYVIIGDDGFPLQEHIMKPYSHVTSKKRRKIFNIRLERARQVVDQAFIILSNRFKIFQHQMKLSVGKVELITKACCVLHNLLSSKNENYLTDPLPADNLALTPFSTKDNRIDKSAQSTRQRFEEHFINEENLC